ncbi:hypothetical protein [uncultured Methanoregula sp.]|uniref:hypothetical protein n=1 Tax=uncultured Methanoregula sp. TaxID=1005933 RepID=UPI002AAAA63A|nr:hypothetical protein [uncultured Methanoregula sp.]
MDKKDIMFGVLAVVILLIIAIVIKPIATGQPVNIGLPASATPTPSGSSGSSGSSTTNGITVTRSQSPLLTQIPTTVPTPAPTWNTKVKSVEFVNPATYGISLNETLPNGTRIDSIPRYVNMTTYATFSGKYSGTTQIMNIPFPYWELWYTVDPIVQKANSVAVVTQAKGDYGAGSYSSDIKGSYSTVKPEFTLQVMDADDPNRIVRVISPPGGIDLNLWLGVAPTAVAAPQETAYLGMGGSILKEKKTSDYDTKGTDPRPWKEKFFEGQKNYYFIINAENLKSYKIDIRIPTKYVGQY